MDQRDADETPKMDYQTLKFRFTQFLPLIIAGGVIFLFVHYWNSVEVFVMTLVGAARPLVIGFVIAYLVNILMVRYDQLLSKKLTKKGIREGISLLGALVTIITVIILLIMLVVPQFINAISTLISRAPDAIQNILDNEFVKKNLSPAISSNLQHIDWNSLVSQAKDFLTSGITSGFSQVMTGFSVLINLIFGIIFAIYLLTGKERLLSQLRRVGRNYLKPAQYMVTRRFCRRLNRNFRNYVAGQCLEAVIFGTLCVLGMTLLRLPYSTMVGTLLGMCSLIPVVGSYFGTAVGAVMVASVSLPKAAIFVVFIIVLVQIEGNLIYPKVMGNSVGLSGIWILAAVTLFGALLGIPGMFIGVPLTSTFYQLFREDLHRREGRISVSNTVSSQTSRRKRKVPADRTSVKK